VTVDKKTGRSVYPKAFSLLNIVTDTRRFLSRIQALVKASSVQLEGGGQGLELWHFELGRRLHHQLVVIGPEFALRGGTEAGLGSLLRVAVHLQRKVLVNNPELVGELFSQLLEIRLSLPTVRTFEVGKLDHGYRRVLRAGDRGISKCDIKLGRLEQNPGIFLDA